VVKSQDVVPVMRESTSTVVPAKAGTRRRTRSSEEPKTLDSRVRGNDEHNGCAYRMRNGGNLATLGS